MKASASASIVLRIGGMVRSFCRDERGNIAMVFGLTMVGILSATGAGIDLSRAYQARQKLSEVATLACQYASRPSVVQMANPAYVQPVGGPSYSTAVTDYIGAALTTQKFGWTQTDSTPFNYTVNGPADVTLNANVPTAVMKIVGVTQVPVAATAHCYDSPSTVPQITPNGNSPYLVQEGFELATCSGTCYQFYQIPGHPFATSSNSFINSVTYTGSSGAAWYAMGYCLETDSAGVIKALVAEGGKSAELDCDNGHNNAGNSSISTRAYMPVGNYELRFNYTSRVNYLNYNPTYICASQASDLSWANDTNSSGGPVANAVRTNQMNVYLDADSSGAPPTHITQFDSQTIAGANLIDTCVYAQGWVERSVRIYVSTPGFYWLSFAADGQNDSYGAQLDNIRLCSEMCPGSLGDSFPPSWLAANNGGTDKLLYEDTFENPAYASTGTCNSVSCSTAGNMNSSLGTSGASTSGWPDQTAAGWAAANWNQMDYILAGATQGSKFLELDATTSGSITNSNRLISRPFLLDPGYYKMQYYYRAGKALAGATGVYCGATPAAANIATGIPTGYDSNFVGAFMSHSLMASTPNLGNALNSATSYTNPAGTTTTTPTAAPDAVSISSYNAAQNNPLLDICGYGVAWQSRTANVKIQKPGLYWLTFSALGTADSAGGQIDDVRVTALGSLYMASPPTSPTPVTIPVPNPQPDGVTNFTGFRIVANPLTPPAPLQ